MPKKPLWWPGWEQPTGSRLNTWSPADRTVWEELGVTLLEQMCHQGQVLRFQRQPFPVCSLPPARCWRWAVSAVSASMCLLHHHRF